MTSFTQHWPLGARYMTLSALGFALMAVFVKLAGQKGIPVLEIVAARALVSLVLSYGDVKRKGISLWGINKKLLFARGAVGAVALVCVYYALNSLPLAEATVLQYLHPMFTALLALFFLNERIQAATFVCILLSFAGLLVIAQPDWLFGVYDDLPAIAMAAAVSGAFGSAVAYVLVRKLSQTEDPSVIIFYFPLIALPLAVLSGWNSFVIPDFSGFVILVLVGIFTQVGQIGLTKAMQTEKAGKATAYSYLQVLFAVILGWAIFGELPSMATWVGGGLILMGALINIFWRK